MYCNVRQNPNHLIRYSNGIDYLSHQINKSISQVGIGGLPHLPQTTTLMAEMIEAPLIMNTKKFPRWI